MIIIHQPCLVRTEVGVRLQAEYVIGNQKDVLWYEADRKYERYFTHERADAFVVGLTWFALKHGHDIEVLPPMSEKLYYTLNHYVVPLIAQVHGYKPIQIRCSRLVNQPLSSSGGAGAGLSCGVDSFSTICDHMKQDVPKKYQISHFTFFNVGSHGDFGGQQAYNLFQKRSRVAVACAKEIGKELIVLNSNISEKVRLYFQPTHTLRSISAALTLQKLFRSYYYSSTYHPKYFDLSKKDVAYFDIFHVPLLSTETTSFFSSCSTYTRFEKTRLISTFKPSYRHLNVCVNSDVNCGHCFKCLKTLLTLDILGKIENYSSAFNLEAYYKAKPDYIEFVKKNSKSLQDPHLQDIYREMMQNHSLDNPI
ncbi:MAG: hypothetical protein K0R75_1078 [Paenibacillaceae bacterium]|nr:hypothetical protein [Paenibacillaceae bacterium]